VSDVLDRLDEYRVELATLMAERFQRHPKVRAVEAQPMPA
jgi:hypothetical protein